MIVCICHRVTDRDIGRAVQQGCDSFESLQNELRVATACGACTQCARETFERASCGITVASRVVVPASLGHTHAQV